MAFDLELNEETTRNSPYPASQTVKERGHEDKQPNQEDQQETGREETENRGDRHQKQNGEEIPKAGNKRPQHIILQKESQRRPEEREGPTRGDGDGDPVSPR